MDNNYKDYPMDEDVIIGPVDYCLVKFQVTNKSKHVLNRLVIFKMSGMFIKAALTISAISIMMINLV